MEVLELHWIPLLHAHIEQKLEEPLPSETFELGDLQVVGCLLVSSPPGSWVALTHAHLSRAAGAHEECWRACGGYELVVRDGDSGHCSVGAAGRHAVPALAFA
eukprot:13906-Eustigmatos_ZCMA.PRE.1